MKLPSLNKIMNERYILWNQITKVRISKSGNIRFIMLPDGDFYFKFGTFTDNKVKFEKYFYVNIKFRIWRKTKDRSK